MTLDARFRAALVGVATTGLLLTACSDGGGPLDNTGPARISGVITADPAVAGAAALAGEDPAGEPLAGAAVRLRGPDGEVLYDSRTDASGEFDIVADAGAYTLEITTAGGETFELQVEVDAGQRLFLQAHVRGNPARPVIDAELFTDDDGDGVSDSGVSLRIVGREAGRPGSGQTIEEDPADDLDEEEQEAEGDGPAALEDFEEGQRVFVKGSGDSDGFRADGVHGNSGRPDRFCRLSGFLTGVQEGAAGVTAVEIFGVTIAVPDADVRGVRGGRGRHSVLAEGTRVEIHATLAEDGTLEALRLHGRGGGGGDPERISGILTAPPDAEAGLLEVCSIRVTVEDGARITNGDGRDEDDGDDGGDDDGDGDDGDDDDEDLSFDDLVGALASGAFNQDARGDFENGVLRLDHLTLAAEARSEMEIVGTVTDLNAGAGTFRLLGLPLVVDAATTFRGNLRGPNDLGAGLRVRVHVEFEDGALAVRTIQPTGEPNDRVRGGVLTLVSSDLSADLNVAIGLGPGIELQADVVNGTRLALER